MNTKQFDDDEELSMEIEEALLVAKAKPRTVAQIRAECKLQGLVYDQDTKKCRPSKRAQYPVPSPPTSPKAKPRTVAQIRADCKLQGLVYDQDTKKCRPSKLKMIPVDMGACKDMSVEGSTASIRLKYKNRKSPPYPAQDCKGYVKQGNDGETYESMKNSAGVYTWRKYKIANVDDPVVIPVGPGIPDEFMPIVDNCRSNDLWKRGKILGAGKYGSTYTACKVSHPKQCDYVLKIQKDSIEFRNEVDALVALKHTGVVIKIYAAWTCNGEGFIILEKAMQCNKPSTAENKRKHYNDIVSALNIIDDEGWLHIDMHSGNVMCRKDGSIVLIDFGWAVKRGEVNYPEHNVSKQLSSDLEYDDLKIIQNWFTAKNFAVDESPEYQAAYQANKDLMIDVYNRR